MYRREREGWAKHLDFMIWDCVCLEISTLIAYFVRHGMTNPLDSKIYTSLFVLVFFIEFLTIIILDTMKDVLKRGYYKEFIRTLWQCVSVLLLTTGYMFLFHNGEEYSRVTIILMALFYFISSYLVRLLWKKFILAKKKSSNEKALLIMASMETAPDLIRAVKEKNLGSHFIAGIVVKDQNTIGKTIEDVPVVASYDDIVEYATGHWVDEILIPFNVKEGFPESVIDDLLLMGITVHIGLDIFATKLGVKQSVSNIGGALNITFSTNFITARQYAAKRIMDICGGLIGTFLTGIIFIFIAIPIKIQSPGPVFFKQTRIGKNGKPFTIYKFRSMYMDAEERKKELMKQNRIKDGLMFKMEFDPRVIGNRIDQNGKQVTGIGEFIRKYSLDEFPQFFNVLKGDMSLVGTRPPLVSEYNEYSAHHKARLAIRPGITGLWQVSGRSNILDFEEVVKLDTEYINNWSIGQDIRILLKTIKVVLKKDGSM